MLKVLGQVEASLTVLIETAVLLAPPSRVTPLGRAALSHITDAHSRDQNVETIAGDIASVVDDLVEESADFAGLGVGGVLEGFHVARTFVVLLGAAGHGGESISESGVDSIGPGLLTAALELVASATTRGVAIVEMSASDNGLAVFVARSDGVVHGRLAEPCTTRLSSHKE